VIESLGLRDRTNLVFFNGIKLRNGYGNSPVHWRAGSQPLSAAIAARRANDARKAPKRN